MTKSEVSDLKKQNLFEMIRPKKFSHHAGSGIIPQDLEQFLAHNRHSIYFTCEWGDHSCNMHSEFGSHTMRGFKCCYFVFLMVIF